MISSSTSPTLAHSTLPVKLVENTPFTPSPHSMIHQRNPSSNIIKGTLEELKEKSRLYGVSSRLNVLSRGLFLRKTDNIKQYLRVGLGLSPRAVEVTMKLLRYEVFYGRVFPSAATLAGEYNVSPQQVVWREREGLPPLSRRGDIGRATVWRTIRILKERGLVVVVNRIMTPYRRQISNLYLLRELMILIVRELARHLAQFWPPYFIPDFKMTWGQFEVWLSTREQRKLPLPDTQ